MKIKVSSFLAAAVLGLASAPLFAENPAHVRAALTPVATPVDVAAIAPLNVRPYVEVIDIDSEQAERLITERRKHQEALEKLRE